MREGGNESSPVSNKMRCPRVSQFVVYGFPYRTPRKAKAVSGSPHTPVTCWPCSTVRSPAKAFSSRWMLISSPLLEGSTMGDKDFMLAGEGWVQVTPCREFPHAGPTSRRSSTARRATRSRRSSMAASLIQTSPASWSTSTTSLLWFLVAAVLRLIGVHPIASPPVTPGGTSASGQPHLEPLQPFRPADPGACPGADRTTRLAKFRIQFHTPPLTARRSA